MSQPELESGGGFPKIYWLCRIKKKKSWDYIRKKEYDNFWIGSQECYCIALKINPWHQFFLSQKVKIPFETQKTPNSENNLGEEKWS